VLLSLWHPDGKLPGHAGLLALVSEVILEDQLVAREVACPSTLNEGVLLMGEGGEVLDDRKVLADEELHGRVDRSEVTLDALLE